MRLTFPLTTKIMYAEESKSTPYMAYCPELDVASAGKDAADAQRMLDEAVRIILEDAAKRGTLREYLASVGFSVKKHTLLPPKVTFSTYSWMMPDTLEKELYAPDNAH